MTFKRLLTSCKNPTEIKNLAVPIQICRYTCFVPSSTLTGNISGHSLREDGNVANTLRHALPRIALRYIAGLSNLEP